MSSNNILAEKDSVESTDEQAVDEEPELRATVQLESQATVDTNHPEVDRASMTLAAEERFEAREAEKARTRRRMERGPSSDREARSRQVAANGSRRRRAQFARRRASVDPLAGPESVDPREKLEAATLGEVNEQAQRIHETVRESGSRAAISRQLAERVARGQGVTEATLDVLDAERQRAGTIVPIGELEDVPRTEVSVEGVFSESWESSSQKISQVGLLEDETGRTKVTAWARSEPAWIDEGERVRIRAAAKNWYQGRVSLAVTGDTRIVFPDRE
jgi:hypothetical protein